MRSARSGSCAWPGVVHRKGSTVASTRKSGAATSNGRRSKLALPKGYDSALKEYKRQVTSTTALLGRVQTHVQRLQHERNEDRDPTVLHPSEIVKPQWCPRQSWYVLSGRGKLSPEEFKFRSLTTFDEGHEVHGKWQRWLWEMGILEGMFYCPVCDDSWWSTSPHQCGGCGLDQRYLVYKEVPVWSDEYRIGGHADGLIEDRVLEIKTVGIGTLRFEAPALYRRYQNKDIDVQGVWDAIKRPLPGHIRQASIYAYILGKPEIVFIYEFKPTQAVREFVVKVKAETVEPILQAAQNVVLGLKSDLPPQRPPHAENPEAPICAECPFRADCWGLQAARPRRIRLGPAPGRGVAHTRQARRQVAVAA